jgi:hypothetical protein
MDRDKLYSVQSLKDRGWTDTAIKRFLPEKPDDTRDNPHFAWAGAPMKFWTVRRVHRVEKTKRFLAWKAGTEKRKEAATRGVETRIDRMIELVEKAEITIQRGWSDDAIHKLAAQTHGGNYAGDPGEFHWSNRTAVNCIRHNLTNYEELWQSINRGDTGKAPYELLRKRVDALIEEAYPQFFGPHELNPAM